MKPGVMCGVRRGVRWWSSHQWAPKIFPLFLFSDQQKYANIWFLNVQYEMLLFTCRLISHDICTKAIFVLILWLSKRAQGNETDSRPSSRAGSPSKFRKISGGSLSRYSTIERMSSLEVDCVSITIIPLLTNDVIVRKSWKVLKCGAIQLQEWEYE